MPQEITSMAGIERAPDTDQRSVEPGCEAELDRYCWKRVCRVGSVSAS